MAYNKIILQGNLVREIEVKYTDGGMAIWKLYQIMKGFIR